MCPLYPEHSGTSTGGVAATLVLHEVGLAPPFVQPRPKQHPHLVVFVLCGCQAVALAWATLFLHALRTLSICRETAGTKCRQIRCICWAFSRGTTGIQHNRVRSLGGHYCSMMYPAFIKPALSVSPESCSLRRQEALFLSQHLKTHNAPHQSKHVLSAVFRMCQAISTFSRICATQKRVLKLKTKRTVISIFCFAGTKQINKCVLNKIEG